MLKCADNSSHPLSLIIFAIEATRLHIEEAKLMYKQVCGFCIYVVINGEIVCHMLPTVPCMVTPAHLKAKVCFCSTLHTLPFVTCICY